MIFERTDLPSRTTAAAVSSQELSSPNPNTISPPFHPEGADRDKHNFDQNISIPPRPPEGARLVVFKEIKKNFKTIMKNMQDVPVIICIIITGINTSYKTTLLC